MSYKASIIVTGGTLGLGFETALKLAKEKPDCLIVIASRSNKDSADDRINKLNGQNNVKFAPLDLASRENIESFVKTWTTATPPNPPIKALVLNAALQFPGELVLTPEGVEKTLAITHLGHALLFHLIFSSLAPDARVVVTSSGTHDPAQHSGIPVPAWTSAKDLMYPPPSAMKIEGRSRYTTAKLANVLWTYSLHRRLEAYNNSHSGYSLTVTSIDPGLMPGTGLAREGSGLTKFLWHHILPYLIPVLRKLFHHNVNTPAESGANLARLAVSKEVEGVSGKYFEIHTPIKSSLDSYDVEKQEDLWEVTVEWCANGDEVVRKRFGALE